MISLVKYCSLLSITAFMRYDPWSRSSTGISLKTPSEKLFVRISFIFTPAELKMETTMPCGVSSLNSSAKFVDAGFGNTDSDLLPFTFTPGEKFLQPLISVVSTV